MEHATTSYPKEKIRILFLENISDVAVKNFRQHGYSQVDKITKALSEDELVKEIRDVHILGIRSKTLITNNVLQSARKLQAIGCFCIGVNQVDLLSATRNGVAVFNAPYSNTRSVAELVIGAAIMLIRRIPDKNKAAHEGVWMKDARGSYELRGKTLGIIGYGNIGSQLSVVAEALGMRVMFYDIADKLALGNARRCETLDELLAEAETVSLHVDGRPGNAGLFGAAEFAKMRPRSLFLNLCRGFVVDHEALRDHLLSGHLAGAAVDVFAEEPKNVGDRFVSSLQGIPNVILTPHIGGSTEEAQQDIGRFVAGKLRDYAATGASSMSVNLPQVQSDDPRNRCRILHVHHNVPGVLATVNGVLADFGVNIESQVLSTRGDLGYVVTDVGGHLSPEVIDKLGSLSETVRLRVVG